MPAICAGVRVSGTTGAIGRGATTLRSQLRRRAMCSRNG